MRFTKPFNPNSFMTIMYKKVRMPFIINKCIQHITFNKK